ncbi:hypothetical protein ZWY2020_011234 [Hordeum vulgare]|nr:hypothetical protein ZWY2020_011234 [Hordeum vulgare]
MEAAADRPPRDGPISSAEARRRRQDIRRGKHPVEDNSFKKCVPLISAVCGSSPIAIQREDNPFKKCVRLISAVTTPASSGKSLDETPTSQSKKRQQNKDGLSPPDRKKSHVAKQ